MKEKLTELKGEIDKATIIVEDFYIPLSWFREQAEKNQ